MTPASLPTDNLYKFMALAGLLLLLFAITYPTAKAREMSLSTIELDASLKKHALEVERLKQELDTIRQKPVEHRTAAEVESLAKSLHALEIQNIEVEAAIAKGKLLSQWLWAYLALAALAGLAGAYLAPRGFALWYRNVQAPLDRKSAAS